MITNVAELLQALLEKEKMMLAKQPALNHAPMLGDMYEGLARHILEKAVFKGLDLRVVEGKARDRQGNLSGQLDCMVVEGEGVALPYTNHFIYDLSRVIAIVEVKKTLYGRDLADSFLHLGSVKNPIYQADKRKVSLVHDAWRVLMRRDFPSDEELKSLPEDEDMIRCVLILQAHEPLRIVLGYSGFQSEYELRKGMIGFLSEHVSPLGLDAPMPGFGIHSFPDQIICGNASLFKTNGMPFGTPLLNSGFWSFYASRPKDPIHIFLELLWTRLSYTYKLPPSIFGVDLELQAVSPLLEAKGRSRGWEYRFLELTKEQLVSGPDITEWQPETVSPAEFVVVNKLCNGEAVSLDDTGLQNWLSEQGTSPDELAKGLSQKHLAFRKDQELFLLTDRCLCVILPDGRYVAGENKTGRLDRWVVQFMQKRKSGFPCGESSSPET